MSTIAKRPWLAAVLLAAATHPAVSLSQNPSAEAEASVTRPNVVLLLLDDAGWSRLKEQLLSLHREVVAEGGAWDIPEDFGADHPRRRWDSD